LPPPELPPLDPPLELPPELPLLLSFLPSFPPLCALRANSGVSEELENAEMPKVCPVSDTSDALAWEGIIKGIDDENHP
jgi:hypothetical protein